MINLTSHTICKFGTIFRGFFFLEEGSASACLALGAQSAIQPAQKGRHGHHYTGPPDCNSCDVIDDGQRRQGAEQRLARPVDVTETRGRVQRHLLRLHRLCFFLCDPDHWSDVNLVWNGVLFFHTA